MVRILPLLLCLLMTPVLAGCSDDPGQPASGDAPGPTGPARQGTAPFDDADPEATADAAGAPVEPQTAICSGTVAAGVGVQGNLQMGVYCAFKEAAHGDLSGYEAAIVEVRWPEAIPTQTRFNLFLLSESCNFASPGGSCNLDFEGHGEPSFRYRVPAGILRADGDDGLRAYASFDGPAAEQPVDIALTLVPAGGVLPEGHSAMPE